jgi:hypothetical protein
VRGPRVGSLFFSPATLRGRLPRGRGVGPGVPGWRGPPARSRGCKQRLRTPTGHRTSQSHSTGQWGTGRGEQATWANMQASWEARAGPTDPLRDGVVWSHPCCAGQSVAPSSPCTAIGSIRGGRRRRHTQHAGSRRGGVRGPLPNPYPLPALVLSRLGQARSLPFAALRIMLPSLVAWYSGGSARVRPGAKGSDGDHTVFSGSGSIHAKHTHGFGSRTTTE